MAKGRSHAAAAWAVSPIQDRRLQRACSQAA